MKTFPVVSESERSIFLLRGVEKLTTKQGQLYLKLSAVCPAGNVEAVVWEYPQVLADMLEPPHLIEATLTHNSKGFQFSEINPLKEEEFNAWDYLPHTPFNPDEMWELTQELLRESVTTEGYQILLESLFEDEEFVRAYQRSPAALSVHHPYRGGLMEHVLSILELVPTMAERYNASEELVALGVFFHDIGKLWEIDFVNGKYTREGELLGHLTIGQSWLTEKLSMIDSLTQKQKTELLHLITSHHGSAEQGSPRAPMSAEAILVHFLDHLDSQMFQYARDTANLPEDSFSARNYLMGRKFYKS